jgi:hypothetical protein
MALSIVPQCSAEEIAEYYMHRSLIFEALGMLDHSKRDLQRILATDPLFIQRYHEMAIDLDTKGQEARARQIREFILKLYI